MKNLLNLILLVTCFTSYSQKTEVIQISTATSGTINIQNTQQDALFIHDAGLTISLGVVLPPTPVDGQKVVVCSNGGITNLNVTSAIGTVVGNITGMAQGGNATWVFSSVRQKWFRIR